MRTTPRLCLVLAVVAIGVIALPAAADAKKRQPGSVKITGAPSHKKQNDAIDKVDKKAENAHERIGELKDWNFTLQNWNKAQQSAIESLQNTVGLIVANVPTITGALTALQSGLLALKEGVEDGFGDVSSALNNPTTGLVGLNLRAPQFGVFAVDGSFINGTGPVNGANPPHGPSGAAVKGSGPLAGAYVVDFGNNVSTRMYSINQAAGGPGVTPLTTAAVNCASPGAGALCGGIQGIASDTSPNKVAVQFGNASTAPATPWTVTALSG